MDASGSGTGNAAALETLLKKVTAYTIGELDRQQVAAKNALLETVKVLPFDQAYRVMELAEKYAKACSRRVIAPMICGALEAGVKPAVDPLAEFMGPLPLKDR